MTFIQTLKSVGVATSLVLLLAAPAQAQVSSVELGTSLANVTFALEDEGATILGVPFGGFGILNPGLYASIFFGDRFAIEPQLGLVLISSDLTDTQHVINFNAQVDYFLRGNAANSPYVFGGVGLVHVNDADTTPTSLSAGAGYRLALGDRLTMRFDGRYTHFTDANGNILAFTVSLGGMFGK